MDGSDIDVDRHLPLRCHLINLGGCVITYGASYGCQLFSEPALAVADEDLYLRSADAARGETLISGPLRTVREVERLADAVENPPDDRPYWPCWTAPWPSGTCREASIPATSPTCSSQNPCSAPWPACRLRPLTGARWTWPTATVSALPAAQTWRPTRMQTRQSRPTP